MKKLFTLSIMALLVLAVMPAVFAVSIGSGIGLDITTEDFAPLVWMCDDRVVTDDNGEYGRVSGPGDNLVERINNYAFEGEQIHWLVLVMDKNKIDQNIDVYATVGTDQGEGNDIEVNCQRVSDPETTILSSCNAKILEEDLDFNSDTMAYFDCTLTVETPDSMYGEHWITVEALDGDGLMGTMDENEYWFLNPALALSVQGALAFEDVRPGTSSYSDTLLVGNDADDGSGVMLDMFISGTDFYDSSSSGARCPSTNQLELDNGQTGDAFTGFRYYVTNGAYNSAGDSETSGADFPGVRNLDDEGYLNIVNTMESFSTKFYNDAEILQDQPQGPYWVANILAPGAEMALTFKLDLPEPCNGDFDTGSIYFWGEAI